MSMRIKQAFHTELHGLNIIDRIGWTATSDPTVHNGQAPVVSNELQLTIMTDMPELYGMVQSYTVYGRCTAGGGRLYLWPITHGLVHY